MGASAREAIAKRYERGVIIDKIRALMASHLLKT